MEEDHLHNFFHYFPLFSSFFFFLLFLLFVYLFLFVCVFSVSFLSFSFPSVLLLCFVFFLTLVVLYRQLSCKRLSAKIWSREVPSVVVDADDVLMGFGFSILPSFFFLEAKSLKVDVIGRAANRESHIFATMTLSAEGRKTFSSATNRKGIEILLTQVSSRCPLCLFFLSCLC